ncbi:hypothetical protein [Rosettibacter firmus]|uniref:hypothetical protein n=1 Tax=Rosettibacter firmus TaxID=3111522 RepID=UPI0031771328
MNEWFKEIDYKKFLQGDLKLLEEIIGIDKFIELYNYFGKTSIYFSEKPLMEMKQEYIRKYFGYKNEKELARLLGVSERLIYKVAEQKIILKEQQDLFEKE